MKDNNCIIDEMAKLACTVFDGDCHNCSFNFYPPCPPKASAERLYNAGYRKQEWISVEERLPVIDTYGKGRYGGARSVRVLCVCKQRDGRTFVKEGYYEPCANGNVVWRIPGSIDSVTHWMPLPEAPKMRKEDDGK